jgi:hypothetical protein
MGEYRLALLITRILAILLLAVGCSWLLVWFFAAANEFVVKGALTASNYRLIWSTYAAVNVTAGLVLYRCSRQIAGLVTKE